MILITVVIDCHEDYISVIFFSLFWGEYMKFIRGFLIFVQQKQEVLKKTVI